jgi:hypothetical protein
VLCFQCWFEREDVGFSTIFRHCALFPRKVLTKQSGYGIVSLESEDVMKFFIYFRGTNNGEVIEAANMNSAKWIFAAKHGLTSISYIAAKKGAR